VENEPLFNARRDGSLGSEHLLHAPFSVFAPVFRQLYIHPAPSQPNEEKPFPESADRFSTKTRLQKKKKDDLFKRESSSTSSGIRRVEIASP